MCAAGKDLNTRIVVNNTIVLGDQELNDWVVTNDEDEEDWVVTNEDEGAWVVTNEEDESDWIVSSVDCRKIKEIKNKYDLEFEKVIKSFRDYIKLPQKFRKRNNFKFHYFVETYRSHIKQQGFNKNCSSFIPPMLQCWINLKK